MKKDTNLDIESDYFTAKKDEGIITISFTGNVMFFPTLLSVKEALFDYLDLISNTDTVKVVINLCAQKKLIETSFNGHTFYMRKLPNTHNKLEEA